MKINYQLELDKLIKENEKNGIVPTLLLHSCCAPCSTYVLEYLSQYFKIYLLYYNPNIYPVSEYYFREEEQIKLIEKMDTKHKIEFVKAKFDPMNYYAAIKGHEKDPEGGQRCNICFDLRLRQAGLKAKELGLDYFTTTLSISPHKNSQVLNQVGRDLEKELGVKYLHSDFKKKNGFKRSVELTAQYNMYRQDYCGCIFSLNESKERQKGL